MSRIEMIFDLLGQKFERISFWRLPEPVVEEQDTDFQRYYEFSNPELIEGNHLRLKPQSVFLPKHKIIQKAERERIEKLSAPEKYVENNIEKVRRKELFLLRLRKYLGLNEKDKRNIDLFNQYYDNSGKEDGVIWLTED